MARRSPAAFTSGALGTSWLSHPPHAPQHRLTGVNLYLQCSHSHSFFTSTRTHRVRAPLSGLGAQQHLPLPSHLPQVQFESHRCQGKVIRGTQLSFPIFDPEVNGFFRLPMDDNAVKTGKFEFSREETPTL